MDLKKLDMVRGHSGGGNYCKSVLFYSLQVLMVDSMVEALCADMMAGLMVDVQLQRNCDGWNCNGNKEVQFFLLANLNPFQSPLPLVGLKV